MVKTFVINLESELNRKNFMAEQLQPFTNFQVSFIQATDGRKLTEAELKNVYNPFLAQKELGRDLSRSEIGCILSHFSIFKKMEEEQIPCALILEDDALISGNLNGIIEQLAKENIVDKPILTLLTPAGYHVLGKRGDLQKYKFYNFTNGYYATGYLINLAAAKIMRKKLFPAFMAFDNWIYYKSKKIIEIKIIKPYLIGLSRSEISNSSISSSVQEIIKKENKKIQGKSFKTIWILVKKISKLVLGFRDQKIIF